MNERLRQLQKELKKDLKKDRFEHTIGVMYTAASLAMRYGADLEQSLTAGLLHDCAKAYSVEEQIEYCKKKKIQLTSGELAMPALIHAKMGAYLAKHRYKIDDSDVIHAIRWHTTGRPDMTLLEKIIYIADYIEPNRKMIPALPEIRTLAFQDLDRAVASSAKGTLKHLSSCKAEADPMTVDTYQYYKKEGEEL